MNARGFTLLEVAIALVIAGLALGVMARATATGLGAVAVAGRTAEALSRARSHLAVVGHGLALRPRDDAGDDGGGYRWTLHIAPVATAPVTRQPGDAQTLVDTPRLTLYRVEVSVFWGAHGQVRLQTATIGPPPP
jgi:general secretion pathway protein I